MRVQVGNHVEAIFGPYLVKDRQVHKSVGSIASGRLNIQCAPQLRQDGIREDTHDRFNLLVEKSAAASSTFRSFG